MVGFSSKNIVTYTRFIGLPFNITSAVPHDKLLLQWVRCLSCSSNMHSLYVGVHGLLDPIRGLLLRVQYLPPRGVGVWGGRKHPLQYALLILFTSVT